jgi:DNA polymerase bacteriophage-type
MPTLFRDFETRSTLDLRDVGAWKYSHDATTDVWCCGYTVDDEPVKLWVPGDPVPSEFVEAAQNRDWIVAAFNDGFERQIEASIMAPRYGWPRIPIEQHRCLQAAALAHALPAKLEMVAKALSLKNQKDEAGHATMMRMARPRNSRKDEDPKGVYWFDDAERREQLHRYCMQDVAVERELHRHIAPLIPEEQALWMLDAKINDRGIYLDGGLLDAALRIAEAVQREIDAELRAITGGEIETVNQVDKLIGWLAAHDCAVTDLQKPTLKKTLTRSSILPEARRVMELRLDGAHAAANKLESMRAWCNGDARARGTFRFHGASTGRWTSFGIQLQNLKRPAVEDMEAAIAAVATGNIDALRQCYPQPMSVVGDITRALIAAPKGHRLIAADLSGIESRVTAWLSGQQSKLDQWANFDKTQDPQHDPYFILGKACGLPQEQARGIGKTADLAFGYMGSVGAWKRLTPDDASIEDQILKYRDAWRRAHPETVRSWRMLDHAAIRAVHAPGQAFTCKRVSFVREGNFLFMLLPSGRRIAYPFPRLVTNNRGDAVVVFKDNEQGKWVDCRHGQGAYGGTWIENAVQAVARDIFAAAMQRLESAGYPIVLHVHDEIVAEVPDSFGTTEEFLKLIITPPSWAEGLPIAAKVRNGPRFCKIKEAPAYDAEEAAPWEADEPTEREEPEAPSNERCKAGQNDDRDGNGYASGEREWGENVASYIYKDAGGNPYLKVVRTSAKQFPQFHWNGGHWVKGKPNGPKIPYRLPELIAAKSDVPIVVCEGERDADNAVALGLVATTNSEGAGKWTNDLNHWFAGKQRVNILEDNDNAGRAHAAKVAVAMHGVGVPDIRVVSFPELPEHGDVSDWIEQGHAKDELLARANAAPKWEPSQLRGARASNIPIAAIDWLWPNRFALGKLGIIAGLPDEGKGLVFADMAARVTRRGLEWPCDEGIPPRGNVLLLTAEDDPRDTVVPRLMSAGADLERIEILSMVRSNNKNRMFSLVTDLGLLRQKIIEVGDVKLVQIDPISAYLGVGKIDSFRTTDVRAVLSPLVDLATELKTAIIGIMHFNKKLDVTNALLRISDSLAFGATARHVYAIIDDSGNKRKLFVKGKNNLAAPDQKTLAFTFDTREVGKDGKSGKPIWAPYVVWQSQYVDVTASEAMQAATESRSPAARDSAKKFLVDMLADGPVLKTEIEEAAEANKTSARTLRRAKDELGIIAKRDGPNQTWRWHLPAPAKPARGPNEF